MAVLSLDALGGIEIVSRRPFGVSVEFGGGGPPRLCLQADEDLPVSLELAEEFGWEQWEEWSTEIEKSLNDRLWGFITPSVFAMADQKERVRLLEVFAETLPDDLEAWFEEELRTRAEAARSVTSAVE